MSDDRRFKIMENKRLTIFERRKKENYPLWTLGDVIDLIDINHDKEDPIVLSFDSTQANWIHTNTSNPMFKLKDMRDTYVEYISAGVEKNDSDTIYIFLATDENGELIRK